MKQADKLLNFLKCLEVCFGNLNIGLKICPDI